VPQPAPAFGRRWPVVFDGRSDDPRDRDLEVSLLPPSPVTSLDAGLLGALDQWQELDSVCNICWFVDFRDQFQIINTLADCEDLLLSENHPGERLPFSLAQRSLTQQIGILTEQNALQL